MLCTVYVANNCTTAAHKPVLNISLSHIEACLKSRKRAHKPRLLYNTLRYVMSTRQFSSGSWPYPSGKNYMHSTALHWPTHYSQPGGHLCLHSRDTVQLAMKLSCPPQSYNHLRMLQCENFHVFRSCEEASEL